MAVTIQNRSELANTLRAYLELTKVRIVLLLIFTTVTAMVIAADGVPPLSILLPTLIGGILAPAGSGAINQYLDRDLDARMARTARRPIPSGRVTPQNALLYGLTLIAVGVMILGFWVNWLTAGLALAGSLYYVVLYTLVLKRNTSVNIVIGGGAGAIPVLVGWAAVTGSLSIEAWLLFGIVFYWTPPHSWTLAILVNTDYARAGVPMMPVARGLKSTYWQILLYSILLLLLSLVPALMGGSLGMVYGVSALVLGLGLVAMTIRLMRVSTKAMARTAYKYSTFYLALLFLAMLVDVAVR
ncbi:MAG: protoheme IX farnesyltransferase [Anaerolineaceae bacterium]|nr:protoheme IX farnesyltransferase [Anaerolineaceae bacterium]